MTTASLASMTSVVVPTARVELAGDYAVPDDPIGVVLFAHGIGSSRRSPRNRYVANVLQHAGFVTLLLDLLTAGEDAEDARTGRHRFDIPVLAERLGGATTWLADRAEARGLPIGYFGARSGAAAALVAASLAPAGIGAVVSRGGRPDLAGDRLAHVRAPTLLIVGGADPDVAGLNQDAKRLITAPCELAVVPGATHLFEERGALDEVARLASVWFTRYLPRPAAPAA